MFVHHIIQYFLCGNKYTFIYLFYLRIHNFQTGLPQTKYKDLMPHNMLPMCVIDETNFCAEKNFLLLII